ncbi:unnamed protein product [Spodoptera littoralis]|uniref:Uncharacterized protein n=1 Tax=Spodoptera littoralis TaxID=7109 RepID=A0A9P0N5S2_SPOLI|nr:unnamed protein product [Spodoptera littoralis]CAH1642543.1 unnamed protein product [Spodoptera littoralis]
MKLILFFTVSLLVGLAYSAPVSSEEDETVVVTPEFFPDEIAVHTFDHDPVKILTPLNALNFEDDEDDESSDSDATTTFVVLADKDDQGKKVYKGLYLLTSGEATKILENGKDAAAANDDTKLVYFAASDGIYVYNAEKKSADKYGSVSDDLIGIAKVNGSDAIYVLSADHFVYKVTENGNKKVKVDPIVDAQQIILDYQNNLFYYTSDKSVYVYVNGEVKKIGGLPEHASYVEILNPAFVFENGAPVIVDNKSYLIYENGTSEAGDFEFQVKPTAYSMEATLIQYYAYNKKVYEYNVLAIILGEVLEELKKFLDDKTDAIQSIATRSRSDLRA